MKLAFEQVSTSVRHWMGCRLRSNTCTTAVASSPFVFPSDMNELPSRLRVDRPIGVKSSQVFRTSSRGDVSRWSSVLWCP